MRLGEVTAEQVASATGRARALARSSEWPDCVGEAQDLIAEVAEARAVEALGRAIRERMLERLEAEREAARQREARSWLWQRERGGLEVRLTVQQDCASLRWEWAASLPGARSSQTGFPTPELAEVAGRQWLEGSLRELERWAHAVRVVEVMP